MSSGHWRLITPVETSLAMISVGEEPRGISIYSAAFPCAMGVWISLYTQKAKPAPPMARRIRVTRIKRFIRLSGDDNRTRRPFRATERRATTGLLLPAVRESHAG